MTGLAGSPAARRPHDDTRAHRTPSTVSHPPADRNHPHSNGG
jgi:hypothetical protein